MTFETWWQNEIDTCPLPKWYARFLYGVVGRFMRVRELTQCGWDAALKNNELVPMRAAKKRMLCPRCKDTMIFQDQSMCEHCREELRDEGIAGNYPIHSCTPDCPLHKIAFPESSKLWPCSQKACAWYNKISNRCAIQKGGL